MVDEHHKPDSYQIDCAYSLPTKANYSHCPEIPGLFAGPHVHCILSGMCVQQDTIHPYVTQMSCHVTHSQEENDDMESEMRDTSEKLRKLMEQSARQQSEYMTAKDQLTSLEKAKVRAQHQGYYKCAL